MSTIKQAAINALQQSRLVLGVLVEFQFKTGPYRAWSGTWELQTKDNKKWQPAHKMGAISAIKAGSATISESFRLELLIPYNDTPDDNTDFFNRKLRRVFNDTNIRGSFATIYAQSFNRNTLALQGPPYAVAKGKLSHPTIRMGRGMAAIEVNVAGVLSDGTRPAHGLVTGEDQRARYAGDTFLDFVSQLPKKSRNFRWPR